MDSFMDYGVLDEIRVWENQSTFIEIRNAK